MNLAAIGSLVRERRSALGLSQQQLAALAGLSRATINQLENGALADLGVAKLQTLLGLVGLQLDAGPKGHPARGLRAASRTASVSYRTRLAPATLAQALATGTIPRSAVAHISTLLDEAPLPIIVAAVEEAAGRTGVAPGRIWGHVAEWAAQLRSPRSVWARVG